MAHEPIELVLYPKHPKEVRKRAEREREDQDPTKRVTRAPMEAEVVTPEDIAKQLEKWALETDATDLKEFTVPRRMRVKKLKKMAMGCEMLLEALELARDAIAMNINRKWQEKPFLKDYATMYVEFYDDELHEHKNSIREAIGSRALVSSQGLIQPYHTSYRAVEAKE